MGKINDILKYPGVAPVADDMVIGSQVNSSGATKNFLFSAIASYINSQAPVPTLQNVVASGATSTNSIQLTGAAGLTIAGILDANSTADIADTLTLSKATGTGLSVTAGATIANLLSLTKASGTGLSVTAGSILNGSLDCYGLHHQWGGLTVEGITTLNNALDANSTADISDTLTLSKATGTGLSVTANATIGGRLTAGTSVVDQAYVAADAFQTNSSSFTATSSAVLCSFGTTFTTFDATIVSCKITGSAPASATAAGTTGTIVTDSGYIYVCTATDTWTRVAVATW